MANVEFIGGYGEREDICKKQCACVCISMCFPVDVSETDPDVIVDEDSDAHGEASGG